MQEVPVEELMVVGRLFEAGGVQLMRRQFAVVKSLGMLIKKDFVGEF